MAELSKENKDLLTGSEVYVPMKNRDGQEGAGFIVSIPTGAKVTMFKEDGALNMSTEDPDGPQATMRASTKARVEQYPERGAHMQTVNGLDSPGSSITIDRPKEGGMSAYTEGDARLSQGVTSISERQVQNLLSQADPQQKSAIKLGAPS